jgi:hypothetical protein
MAAMPEMTGSRVFAEMMKGYGVSHVFFVPAVLMQAMAKWRTWASAAWSPTAKNRPPTWPSEPANFYMSS